MFSLKEIFENQYPADKVIQRQLKGNRKWGSKDRRLFAEALYDLVRWRRRLMDAAGYAWPEADELIANDAQMNAKMIEFWCALHDVHGGNGLEASGIDLEAAQARWEDPSLPRAVRESIPDWMDRQGHAELGDVWDSVLTGLNLSAPVFLRANRLQATTEQVIAELKAKDIESWTVSGDAIQLKSRANVFMIPAFEKGWFEVQDLSSQAVAPALQVEPGMRVIDACAGAGGKTLHLAALMKNKGKIVAMDVGEKKLEELRRRSNRAGATIIETRLIESTKTVKRLEGSADRVLLDVPCSGLGVLRRNPDAKWKLKPSEMENLRKLQADILRLYSQMVKPAGKLVYATCSLLPSENGAQVKAFLAAQEGKWQLEAEESFLPKEGSGDGFYYARLSRV